MPDCIAAADGLQVLAVLSAAGAAPRVESRPRLPLAAPPARARRDERALEVIEDPLKLQLCRGPAEARTPIDEPIDLVGRCRWRDPRTLPSREPVIFGVEIGTIARGALSHTVIISERSYAQGGAAVRTLATSAHRVCTVLHEGPDARGTRGWRGRGCRDCAVSFAPSGASVLGHRLTAHAQHVTRSPSGYG